VSPPEGLHIDPETRALAVLSRLGDPGDRDLGAAVDELGAAAVAEGIVSGASGLDREAHYRSRLPACDVDADLAALASLGGRLVGRRSPEWPSALDDLGTARPLVLWVRGAPLPSERAVALVGARAASAYGVHVTADLAAGLAERGWCVVSGGAYGIDASAHRGALSVGGATLAILACGVDLAYPRGHTSLFDRIADQGTLVSEVPPGSPPMRVRFLTRNRLIAAMCAGTVVVEAAYRSGALNTAHHAEALNRPVGAVPGPVTSVVSAGCHALIRDQRAVLVGDADEVVELVGDIGEVAPTKRGPVDVLDSLDATSKLVLDAVPRHDGASIEVVSMTAGRSVIEVGGTLGRLALLGLVDQDDDGRWRTAARAAR
jgi:DNA processing protein